LFEVVTRPFVRTGADAPHHMDYWWYAVSVFAIYILCLLIAWIASWWHHPFFASDTSKKLQIACDTCVFGLFYLLNGDPQSNLVLGFWLPLIIAARYFSSAMVIAVFGSVLAVFAGSLVWLNENTPSIVSVHTPARIFMLRSVLFACTTLPLVRAEYLYRRLKRQTSDYRQRMDSLLQHAKLIQRQRIDNLIAEATEAARKELNAEVVSLFLYGDGLLRRKKSAGIEDGWFPAESYRLGEGITGAVAADLDGGGFGSPVLDNNVADHPLVKQDNVASYQRKLRSGSLAHIVAVPLDGSNRTFGVLRAMNKLDKNGKIDPRGFTQRDLDLLSSISTLVALAYASLRREEKVNAMLDLADSAVLSVDETQICRQIAELAVRMGYSICCVLLYDVHSRLHIQALQGISPSEEREFTGLRLPLFEQLDVLCSGRPNAIADLQNAAQPETAGWARRLGISSACRLPLQQHGQVIGIVEVYTRDAHQFYSDELDTLIAFAAKAAIAIGHVRLSERNREHMHRLRTLADTINEVTSCTDQDILFERVAHKVAALIKAEDCSIFWLNRELNTIDLKASHCVPKALFRQGTSPLSDRPRAGLPAFVAATGKPLHFLGNMYKSHEAWNGEFLEHLAYLPSKDCMSLMIYPVRRKNGSVCGVIKVENKVGVAPHEGFNEADRELLDVLAIQVVVAMNKIEQIHKLQHLNDAARTITKMGAPREVLRKIAEYARDFAQADLAVICPYDAETEELLIDDAAIAGQRSSVRMDSRPRHNGLTHEVLMAPQGYVVVEDLDQAPDKLNLFVEQEGVRSVIAIALRMQNQPVGILYYDFRQPRHFSAEQIHHSQAFGELAAIAISNANILAREQQTIQELSAIQGLTKIALQKVELDGVLDVVVRSICDTIGFELCTVSLVNQAERTIEMRRGRGASAAWVRQARHTLESNDIQAWIVRTGQTEVISGYDTRLDREIYERFGHEHLIRVFTPIVLQKRVIGTIEAGYDRRNQPSISQPIIERLQRYLEPVALVIENALLLEQTRRDVAHLQHLHDVSQQMDRALSQKNTSQVLQLATEGVSAVMGADVVIHTYDYQTDQLKLHARSANERVSADRQAPLWLEEVERVYQVEEPAIREGRYRPDAGVPSARVPLKIGGEVFGTLSIMYDRDHWFSQEELRIIDLCAVQAAIAISIARVHQQLNRRLDQISDDIEQAYHSAIGQRLVNIGATIDNLLDARAPLGELNQRQADRLQRARASLAELQLQIQRLLLARWLEEDGVSLAKQPVDLNTLVGEAIRKVQRLFDQKQIGLTWVFDPQVTTLDLDGDRILEVIVDLLTNASKFTPAVGAVQVWSENRPGEIRLAVSDNGRGIGAENIDRVFEKYVQIAPLVSNKKAGVGLGLYLARKLMEQHGGTIVVESTLGKGSVFILTFPNI
jgi:signal transduction histidine kinase